MKRVVSVFLPTWPADRLLRRQIADKPPPDALLVLAGHDGRRRIIQAANRMAIDKGVRCGMSLAHASAAFGPLHVHEWDPDGDAAALEQLAYWAYRRYSPLVTPDPPDGLTIDISGASHLHGGEINLINDIHKRLMQAHIHSRICAAGTFGAAHALARHGGHSRLAIPTDTTLSALSPLPAEALRLAPSLAEALKRVGIETVSDLASTPRAPLELRFGPEPGQRLDQALGLRPELFSPIRPPDSVEVDHRFQSPLLTSESLVFHIDRLSQALCEELERRGLGALRIDLMIDITGRGWSAFSTGLSGPTRDASRFMRLLRERIQTVDTGFGVERLRLTASRFLPHTLHQRDMLSTASSSADIGFLIEKLDMRTGGGRLYRFAAVESEIPERSVCRIPPLDRETHPQWDKRWPRPARLLAPPDPIETLALLPDHPPAHFIWKGIRRRVVRADGPERIHGEWIHSDEEFLSVRDYFTVEDETGTRYWLFREGDGQTPQTGSHRWFLHGLFG